MLDEIVGVFTGQNRRNKSKSVAAGSILGFLGGAVIGSVVGVLFAPKPGIETREELGDKAVQGYETVRDKASEVTDKVTSKVSDTYNQFKDTFDDEKREARRVAREARRSARNVGDIVGDAASDIGDEVEDVVDEAKS